MVEIERDGDRDGFRDKGRHGTKPMTGHWAFSPKACVSVCILVYVCREGKREGMCLWVSLPSVGLLAEAASWVELEVKATQ